MQTLSQSLFFLLTLTHNYFARNKIWDPTFVLFPEILNQSFLTFIISFFFWPFFCRNSTSLFFHLVCWIILSKIKTISYIYYLFLLNFFPQNLNQSLSSQLFCTKKFWPSFISFFSQKLDPLVIFHLVRQNILPKIKILHLFLLHFSSAEIRPVRIAPSWTCAWWSSVPARRVLPSWANWWTAPNARSAASWAVTPCWSRDATSWSAWHSTTGTRKRCRPPLPQVRVLKRLNMKELLSGPADLLFLSGSPSAFMLRFLNWVYLLKRLC